MEAKITVRDLFDLSYSIAGERLAAFTYPHEALPHIGKWIEEIGATLDPQKYDHPSEGVWIAKSAEVAPSVQIDGPAIVCEGAKLRHCAYLRANVIIGAGATVGNSSEIKNAILFDGAQVPHFNYVGDSILGHRAHLGAAAILSNFRGDGANINVRAGELVLETGMRKVGAFIGDFGEIGCGCVLNPGTVVGRRAMIYPLSSVRGFVPEQHIYKDKDTVVPRVME
ncbi:MAG: UDP-N-acetylglucosamine pyrophosphorylase [Clostridia bacterium]|nr:UDP-N-acetylglucosamine pyrophosphorylase [Clostridia bacterium]MBR3863441.1 UDP-N-acetylglucosamine pyrophosphorylase [Clostridia bacterium]